LRIPVAVLARFIGIAMSHVVRLPNPLPPMTFELGEPPSQARPWMFPA
jgi:hypothetical protein